MRIIPHFELSGVNPALVTLFEDGLSYRVDQNAMLRNIRHKAVDFGAHGVVGCGFNGEGNVLSVDQIKDVFEVLATASRDIRNLNVVAGVMRDSPTKLVDIARLAGSYRIDALLVAPPIDYVLEPKDFAALIGEVVAVSGKSVILYNTGLTKSPLTLDYIKAVQDRVGLALSGVKHSRGDNDLFAEIANEAYRVGSGLGFQYVEGDDRRAAYTFVAQNALRRSGLKDLLKYPDAIISGSSNYSFFCTDLSAILMEAQSGDARAYDTQRNLTANLGKVLGATTAGLPKGINYEPAVWKALVNLELGNCSTSVMPPLVELTAAQKADLGAVVRKFF